jgi:hypothetical protein
MKDAIPEPRTAAMILVEASWQDQNGTLQTARARMENTSASGACIRLKREIGVGAKLRVYWRWEEFSGVTKYCRKEGTDYRVGIRRDVKKSAIVKKAAPETVSQREGVQRSPVPPLPETLRNTPKLQEGKREIPVTNSKAETVPIVNIEKPATAPPSLPNGHETNVRESPRVARARDSSVSETAEIREKPPADGKKTGKERKPMRSKWLEMAHWGNKDDAPNANGSVKEKTSDANETNKRAPEVAAAKEKTVMNTGEDTAANLAGELLSMDDIYLAAGIVSPRRGCTINKVIEMLHSEHLRGLTKEMCRASVLMALDAAGVSIDEVVRDARARQEAIDAYHAEQRKQFEVQRVHKAEENTQIQAELESVKARFMERVRRNLDGVARDKAAFGSWLTTKQQESQRIAEAVELCLNPHASEPANSSMAEVSMVDASAKPL